MSDEIHKGALASSFGIPIIKSETFCMFCLTDNDAKAYTRMIEYYERIFTCERHWLELKKAMDKANSNE